MGALAVFTLGDEQIVWTDKSSDSLVNLCEFKTVNSANFQANFPQISTLFASSILPRRANRPFVHLSPSECEFRLDFGRLVHLDGQTVFTDGQTDGQIQMARSSENLFVPFSHQTICPSETICLPRQLFVFGVKTAI